MSENSPTSPGAAPPDRLPEILPVVPVTDVALFPKMQLPMSVSQPDLVQLVDEAMQKDRVIGVLASRKKDSEGVQAPADLYRVGTAALIIRMAKLAPNSVQMIVQGLSRFAVSDFVEGKPYIQARVSPAAETGENDTETQALRGSLLRTFSRMVDLSPVLPNEMGEWLKTVEDPGLVADVVASATQADLARKQEVLETLNVKERLRMVNDMAARQVDILELESKIQSQVKGDMDKSQREYYLRQQMKAIRDELGERDENRVEVEDYRTRIAAKGLPEVARKEAERELERLARMHPSSSEYTVSSTYLDWLTALPWNEETADNLDIKKAQEVLDEDHFGLEKPKQRIIEYLAVRKLKPDSKGPILCFAGPPGTGKTSLGKSIARALGRKFVRMSLGGVRDEAEIRGHRRTYVGALPGNIIQGIRRAESRNPVFILDEIDKVGTDFRGDPSSALLEVLDPEQNDTFTDHYLDVPFDLSRVLFLTTANILDTIPPALRDRMEVIQLSGYTQEEKTAIAKKYLIPRQRTENGLSSKQIHIRSGAVTEIITGYTREAGLRNLEREIAAVCRGVARKIAEGSVESVTIGKADVKGFLGPRKLPPEDSCRQIVPGVVTGLAWTSAGGDILFVEAARMSGGKGLTLTGQLGEVMKESASAALTYVRSHLAELGIAPDFFDKNEIHIHVPAGAIPKDGPSAGVAMLTAIASIATGKPVKRGLAMTGEITLRGQVLPVGGIKEKVLAAYRAKIREVILPRWNENDLDDVPQNVREKISFHFADRMDEVLSIALSGAPGKC